MKIIISILCMLSVVTATSQDKKEQQAIRHLCGCYEVEFMYAETFAPNTNYTFSKPYNAHGLEWVEPVEISDRKIVLQHLLQLSDSLIIKHWREDWEYEKAGLWHFDKEATWRYDAAAVRKGHWTQTVWEVDDAPRYQGMSRWINNNSRYYWENTTDAPLPRREYSTRSDYNVLQRTNRIVVTDTAWTHEQDNTKIARSTATADKIVAQEKGYNIYTKVPDSKCAAAANWWKQHGSFWNTVRSSWDELLQHKVSVKLLTNVDGRTLSQQLDQLEKANSGEAERRAKAIAILRQFAVTDNNDTAAGKH